MRVTAGALSLAVHALGGPEGAPAILWLHANGFAARAYGPFLRQVAQFAQVFAMDLRGHGESDAVPAPFEENLRIGLLEADLSLVVQAVRERNPRIHLAAHSLGALPVLRFLARDDASVASATIFEAAAYPPQGHPVRAEAEALTAERVARTPKRRAQWASPEEFSAALARSPAFAAMPAEDRLEAAQSLLRADAAGFRLRCDPAVETFLFTQVALAEEFGLLPRIRCPVRVVAGDVAHPGATWVTHMQADVAAAIPQADLHRAAGQGHLLPLEAPGACAALLREWVLANPGNPDGG